MLLKTHHHHKHQGLDPLIRSVSTVTATRANASSVFQFVVLPCGLSGMISKGFGFVAFFANVKARSVLCHNHHHHHKHQGLDSLIRSVSTVTATRANTSSVFQLFSFLVVCSGMISKRFGFVAFFASVKTSISPVLPLEILSCVGCPQDG